MALLAQLKPAMSPVIAKLGACNGAIVKKPPAPSSSAWRRVVSITSDSSIACSPISGVLLGGIAKVGNSRLTDVIRKKGNRFALRCIHCRVHPFVISRGGSRYHGLFAQYRQRAVAETGRGLDG